jgi:hypothetical protein
VESVGRIFYQKVTYSIRLFIKKHIESANIYNHLKIVSLFKGTVSQFVAVPYKNLIFLTTFKRVTLYRELQVFAWILTL